jgi:hypothetical protein
MACWKSDALKLKQIFCKVEKKRFDRFGKITNDSRRKFQEVIEQFEIT